MLSNHITFNQVDEGIQLMKKPPTPTVLSKQEDGRNRYSKEKTNNIPAKITVPKRGGSARPV
jgi:hypothetical protein